MYWDSSALVPALVPEARSAGLLHLLGTDRSPAIWWASPVECQSALHRRQREQGLARAALGKALLRLRALAEDLDVVAPTGRVRDRAGRLLAAHPLRAADALQLAAALVWCDDAPEEEGFVCLDHRLREAARREGFDIFPGEKNEQAEAVAARPAAEPQPPARDYVKPPKGVPFPVGRDWKTVPEVESAEIISAWQRGVPLTWIEWAHGLPHRAAYNIVHRAFPTQAMLKTQSERERRRAAQAAEAQGSRTFPVPGGNPLTDLYADDPRRRLEAARTFPAASSKTPVPALEELPSELQALAKSLGREVYGAINAWMMFVGPSPGGSPPHPNALGGLRAHPPPVLGRAHPNFRWPDRAGFWTKIRSWSGEGFRRASVFDDERDALSVSLVVNLLDEHATDSRALRSRLPQGLPRFWNAVEVTQPRLVVALTGDVYDAVLKDLPARGAKKQSSSVVQVGRWRRPDAWIELASNHRFLLARAPMHPSRPHPVPETYDCLARLISTVIHSLSPTHRP